MESEIFWEDETIPKILVVDDNVANIDVMLTFLEAQGYELSIATDGDMAVRVASHNQPDLILLDVMMPGMDGFQTCKMLQSNPETENIPIIFVTAKKETTDIVRGFESGGVDYISKPFRQEEVLSRVDTHLKLRRLSQNQQRLIAELQKALAEVKTLSGILPICSSCKKIRDKQGNWHVLESYIKENTEANFTHGVCKDCFATLYPNLEWREE